MNKSTSLKVIDQVASLTGLDFIKRPFLGISGVAKGTKGFRKGPNVWVTVFYGGERPGIRVTIKDKLKEFPLDTPADVIAALITERVMTPRNDP